MVTALAAGHGDKQIFQGGHWHSWNVLPGVSTGGEWISSSSPQVRGRAFPELCCHFGSAVIPSRIPATLEAEGIDLPLNIYKDYK